MEYIRKIVMSGGEVRTLDEVIDRLIIFDRSIAFISISDSPRADGALEVRHPAIVHFLMGIFENSWKRAQPVDTGYNQVRPADIADDIQRAILRFLVGGYTEVKIARQLGMSQRTVATHIRRISDRLGSTSRAQLGYLVGVRNLLDE